MLAMADRKGRVWASIPGLANRARVSLEECEEALGKFQSPDTYSRTPDFEGRRIEKIDGGWQLLNYAKYREMRDEEARKEYKRDWIRERRQNESTVDRSGPLYTKAEAEAEAEAEKEKKGRFTPPSLDEVTEYMTEKGRPEEAIKFWNFYESKGWKVGKTKMEKWRSAAANWVSRLEPKKAVQQWM